MAPRKRRRWQLDRTCVAPGDADCRAQEPWKSVDEDAERAQRLLASIFLTIHFGTAQPSKSEISWGPAAGWRDGDGVVKSWLEAGGDHINAWSCAIVGAWAFGLVPAERSLGGASPEPPAQRNRAQRGLNACALPGAVA